MQSLLAPPYTASCETVFLLESLIRIRRVGPDNELGWTRKLIRRESKPNYIAGTSKATSSIMLVSYFEASRRASMMSGTTIAVVAPEWV